MVSPRQATWWGLGLRNWVKGRLAAGRFHLAKTVRSTSDALTCVKNKCPQAAKAPSCGHFSGPPDRT